MFFFSKRHVFDFFLYFLYHRWSTSNGIWITHNFYLWIRQEKMKNEKKSLKNHYFYSEKWLNFFFLDRIFNFHHQSIKWALVYQKIIVPTCYLFLKVYSAPRPACILKWAPTDPTTWDLSQHTSPIVLANSFANNCSHK